MSLFSGEERRAEITGAIVLVGVAAAVVFAIFFAGRIRIGRHVRARVHFDQVSGMGEGAGVMVAGRKVGVVEGITLTPGGGADASVRIDLGKRDMVPVNGDFFISSRGVLSERFLEIGPPRDGSAPGRPIADGDTVQGSSPPSLDRAIQHTWDNLERARTFAAAVGPEAHDFATQIGALGATLGELDPGPTPCQRSIPGRSSCGAGSWNGLAQQWSLALDEAKASWAAIEAAGADPAHAAALAASVAKTTAAARQTLALVRGRASQLAEDLARVSAHGAGAAAGLDHLRAALADFDATSAKLDHLLAQAQAMADAFARGEGSLAKLSSDPEFPEDAKELGRILKNQPWRIIAHPPDSP